MRVFAHGPNVLTRFVGIAVGQIMTAPLLIYLGQLLSFPDILVGHVPVSDWL